MTTSRFAALLLVILTAEAAHADDVCSIPATGWKNLATCPLAAGRNVTIGPSGCGSDVYVDHTTQGTLGTPLGIVTIAAGGRLVFVDEETALHVGIIDVKGTLQVGAPACPITKGTATITFHGDATSATVPGGMAGDLNKGILVDAGGALVLHGAKGVTPGVSWTHLAAPAGPETGFTAADGVASPVPAGGATTLQVATQVDWEAGDWIVVATTDFVPYSSEFVRIASVTSGQGTSTVTLDPGTPLLNYHFGGPAPSTGVIADGKPYAGLPASFQDDRTRNWGIDERAEVGLLSRRIKLTAEMGSDVHWGGEIRILPDVARAELRGVELEKFGKDQTGSYPLHFHMVGSAPKAIVDGNSIHHTFNKCVTLHYTDDLTLANNVCARIVDHAFYLESQWNSDTATPLCQAMPPRVPGHDNTFEGNLAVSVMSTHFTLPDAAHGTKWFDGDYMTNGHYTDATHGVPNGYDGLDVASNTCDDAASRQTPARPGHDPKTALPVPSGFWITNPANTFRGNSVAGCQGMGRGFWLLPTVDNTIATHANDSFRNPLTAFAGNRAHGCALGLDSGADVGVGGDRANVGFANFEPLAGQGGTPDELLDLLTVVDGFTATRNRDRGVWLRDKFYHVANARLASNRDSISLVSGGGPESSKPGIWGLLSDSVIVGETANNPGRFGDCPEASPQSCAEVDLSKLGKGYPNLVWNAFGFMFYDGPARLENVRFVNFKRDIGEFLTHVDAQYLTSAAEEYEGDAALGWFQSNKNAYPPTQYTKGLSWENVDFRHQVYTENVNVGDFSDGDKNTVILDRDGTLSGFKVVTPASARPRFPISLNNLGFNSTPWSVDECGAEGAQDAQKEGRPSALMSPHDVAGLEVSLAVPPRGSDGKIPPGPKMTFRRDTRDFCEASPAACEHQSMTLVGRNDTYTYEPKAIRQLGYTMGGDHGVTSLMGVGLVDAHPASTDAPFRVRLGVCYRTESGTAPSADDAFNILRGRRSWGSPSETAPSLTVAGLYHHRGCNNLEPHGSRNDNLDICPSPQDLPKAGDDPVSTDALEPLAAGKTLDDLTSDTYFYDADAGMLYFYVEEDAEGAGPSPLGTCGVNPADPACAVQSWYQCPPTGCQYYTVAAPSSYAPQGATTCDPYAKGSPYEQTEYPAGMNQLAYSVPAGVDADVQDGEIVTTKAVVETIGGEEFPHNVAVSATDSTKLLPPWCPETWVGPLPAADDCSAPAGLVQAAGSHSACTAYLPRSIAYGARRATNRPAPILTAWDWIGVGSYELRGPLGMVSAEDVVFDPDGQHYLAYDMRLRSSETSSGVREGIVVRDELGTHDVDTLGAERLLLPAGVSIDGSVPAARGPIWDTYTCHRVARKRRAGKVTVSYTDASGTHDVRVSREPRRLCIESDVGDGLGHVQANVTCYPIKRSSRRRRLKLEATDRTGTLDVVRRAPAEICLEATVEDRGH